MFDLTSTDPATSLSQTSSAFTDGILNQRLLAASDPYALANSSKTGVGVSAYTTFLDNYAVSGATVGSTLATAYDFGTLIGSRGYSDVVDSTNPLDVYQFQLDASSSLSLFLDGLTADADLWLAQDFDNDGLINSSEVLASSERGSSSPEAITLNNLAAGNYFVLVGQYSGDTAYNFGAFASPTAGLQQLEGSLWSDTFSLTNPSGYTVISGNGNVDAGYGYTDLLDLSTISYYSVSWNLASASTGGVIFDPGNGARLFDAISLSNGSQVLFEGIDRLAFAEGFVDLSVTPNDPLFQSQWNLHMMGVDNAWRFTTGSSGVLVGVQDTGLGVDSLGNFHPDLGTTVFYADNVTDDFFRVGVGARDSSHGTSVQSIISAATNNGYGMSGINWNSPVFNIDVLDGNAGDQSLAEAAQNMINYANSMGQRLIVNMSLGGGGLDPVFEQLVANNQTNALFVIASGNGDGALSSPAILAQMYSNVIAVGASWGMQDVYGQPTTPGDRISYPGWWGSNFGYGLTLMGPSEVIATTAAPSSLTGANFDFSDIFNGTSAATPNVAGVASLVWSANPFLTANQVQWILSQTAYDLGSSGYDPLYGNGFVNADAAVRRAMAISRMNTGYSFSTATAPLLAFNGQLANPALALASADVDGILAPISQVSPISFSELDTLPVDSTIEVEVTASQDELITTIVPSFSFSSDEPVIRYSSDADLAVVGNFQDALLSYV